MKQDHHTFALACFILALLLGCMYWIATPARSQENPACGPRAEIDKRMWVQFGESPIGIGITQNGWIYITNNPQTGSFTVILRRPDGTACLMTGGTGWTGVDPLIPGRDL